MGQNKCRSTCLCFCLSIVCFFIFSDTVLLAREVYHVTNSKVSAQQAESEYLVFLLGNAFFLPEFVDITFNSDFSVSLKSDLFVQPAQGTYLQDNKFTIKAEATTGKFFDPDFQEDIEIQYAFTCVPLGLRGFFMIGGGSRTFIFFVDGHSVPERFFFFGTGF
jgi:hypothetical protein